MFKNFVKNEDGIETIEFIGMVAVAAVLIVAATNIGSTLKSKASAKLGVLSQKLDEINP